jgi:ribosomal protein S18 acetylase RimI-like enzyme
LSRIRAAAVGDGRAVGRVHVAAWQAGYRGQLPDEILNAMSPEQRGEAWERLLQAGGGRGRVILDDSPASLLLAEDDTGEIVGICAYGEARGGELVAGEAVPAGTGELMFINFEPGSWGTGLARQLLDAAVAGLRQMGYAQAVLFVLDTNSRAQRFYEKAGWRPDGAVKIDERPGLVLRELRYRTQL